jgi:hypothetical protein
LASISSLSACKNTPNILGWVPVDSFLKSSRRESILLYELSSDNPQKDNFHNLVFDIDKTVAFDILDPTILIKFLFPKGVVDIMD